MKRWWSGRPLRTRLVLSSIAMLAVVLTVIAVVSTFAIQAFLMDELDHRVEDAGRRAQASFDPNLPHPDHSLLGFLQGPGIDPRALGMRLQPNGGVEAAGVLNGAVPPTLKGLSAQQAVAVANVSPDFDPHTRGVPGLGDYRLIAVPDATGEVIITGLPMKPVQDTVGRVVGVEVVVAVAGLIVAGLAGAAIVRLALRPLRRVAGTATRVSEQTLHEGEVAELERVPAADTDPRTEVGQVGASLNRLLDHVGAALTARHASETRIRRFVADASHELRTPLASIRGYAELTRRGHEPVPRDTAHALRRIESEATRMTSLVEDLLLLARLDSGRPVESARVDPVPLVIDALSDARAAGPDHHWRLDVPDEPSALVEADSARLYQVLVNLLANARTHTPPGTWVTASVRREGDEVVLSVADDGPGVPPDVLPRVFERFTRGDSSRSRAAGSTGLGLAIVSAVVEAHGGTVHVTSSPGSTVFSVRLPAAH
ncbi:sensor histidine kinase [Wenjunlia tyrosinilytica]|uniref:histidine kinase n=1 Tax=Wenjunlia tyrosinilytica TaxID=1544741 RepID=A0A918A0G3_9ACTN|nr:HAMP domain-containing sensor histidine kinase [Wenjunlia tyrosinilytica]GGP00951.1 two-component sensor histidine kinase [Wenjunlia tyrosinilytica]